jgi:glutamate racemase
LLRQGVPPISSAMSRLVAPEAPILFLDSGIGGFSVLEPTRALLPRARIIYAADYAGIPYGTKSEIEVATRVCALLGMLAERYRPRLAVIACNTASTIALGHARAVLDLPIVGTVPAIKPAALASRSRTIGVLGTAATIRQPYVDRLSAEFAADCTVLRHAAPELVDAAEAKLRGEAVDPAILAGALSGLTDQIGGSKLDTVVLACTHFPLLRDEFAAARPDLNFVDGSEGIARQVAALTVGQPWQASPECGLFLHTSNPAVAPPPSALITRYGFGASSRV